MLENERIVKARKKNMKLYPIYRMVGVDIFFICYKNAISYSS